MNKGISLKTYRLIDLAIFTGLLVLFEIISFQALSWFKEKYYISLFFSICLIVIMRWNAWATIPILAGSVVYCLKIHAGVENYIIYIIGNLFMLGNLLWFIKGKNCFRKNHIVFLYVTSGYLLVEIGRSLVAVCFAAPFFSTLIGFLGTDFLNYLLTLLIIFIVRRQDGVFEDQLSYLKRIGEDDKKTESSFEVNEHETHL